MDHPRRGMTRRAFLRRSSAAAGAAVAFPTVIPSSVLGATAPSKLITMASIGIGGMGGGLLGGFLGRRDMTRFLAIIVGINGIVLTGIIVTMAIEAAKIAVENSTSIEAFRQEAKERSQRRFDRERDRLSKQGNEEA